MEKAPLELERDNVELLPKESEARAAAICKGQAILNGFLFVCLLVSLLSTADSPPTPAPRDGSRAACSGHGMLFDDAAACECFDCWTGSTCSERLPDESELCVVVANSGTPYIFEQYWVAHPEAAISIKPSYHIGYNPDMPRLEAAIRSMHELVGNAVVDETKHVVVGIGSTELINAALYALADDVSAGEHPSSSPPSQRRQPAAVWTQTPFYSGYRSPPAYFRSRAFEWAWDADPNASTAVPPPTSAARRVIELVTSPNNPDGHLRVPVVSGAHSAVVMDHAYLWPHFVATGAPPVDHVSNSTISLWTLSKVSGHASTRVGWAITSCPVLAARLTAFVRAASYGAPRESQLRAIAAIEHIVAHDGELFRVARRLMLSRWRRLEDAFARHGALVASTEGVLAASPAYRLEGRDAPAADAFSAETSYEASPAYAWVQKLDGGDCLAAMASVGIVARPGGQFGVSHDFVRLELLMREQTFVILLAKLDTLLGVASG